ncbi:MAG: murein biosynthesis integral membrane protein MurJ [Endomicrobium sp.]|jgi:putative peptidoglycan lipid II flippase|nr:murein biosynthesis integral membrane protein MurJ [Endomicrobium sp.]
MKNKTTINYVSITSIGIFISRIFGYIRDMLIANVFGAGIMADTFYAALKIPNLFRRIFGEGSFSSTIVPVFTEYLNKKNKAETQKFLNVIFTYLLLTLILTSLLGIVFANNIVKLVAIGFNTYKMKLTVNFIRFMFPLIIFIGLAAFLVSILNVLHSFFIPAITPAIANIIEIFYIIVLAPFITTTNYKIKGLICSIVLGYAFYYLIQYHHFKKFNWKLNFLLDLKHSGIRRVVLLMIPSILGASVEQINIFVDSNCASFLGAGSITALYYANRLVQLPLAIFGISFTTVAFPEMSKACMNNDIIKIKDSIIYSMKFTIFTLFPAMLGLMFIGLPIIKLLFEHGRFNNLASDMTYKALFYYSLGLPAYAWNKIITNVFYSYQDTKTPLKLALFSMIFHIVLCILLMKLMTVSGLALATSLSSYFNFFCLIFLLDKRIKNLNLLNKIFVFGLKCFFAATVSNLIVWGILHKFKVSLLILVPISIIISILLFIITSYILNISEFKYFLSLFFKKCGL